MTTPKYRKNLPLLDGRRFLTDGGLETVLIFNEGFELPLFAAFTLLKDQKGVAAIKRYFAKFCEIARTNGTGFILDTPTWRASKRWADELGYSDTALKAAHEDAVTLMNEIRDANETETTPYIVNGVVGPNDDGYNPNSFMTAKEAEDYHAVQIGYLDSSGVDMITALTMTYVQEAIGIAKAARAKNIPCVISFTVETDGRLPSGQTLKDAIQQVDRETDNAPIYFMINCAHPDHFVDAIANNESWLERIRGVRANASRMSHEELDNSEELDNGDPQELGKGVVGLTEFLPNLTVFGGCCGTDHRHIEAMARSCRHEHAA